MKSTARFLWFALSLVVLAVVPAHAQNDWQVVKTIPAGSPIKVYADKPLRCNLQFANDEGLGCKLAAESFPLTLMNPFVYPRSQVREIHLEHPHKNAAIGMAIGATLGAVAFTRNTSTPYTRDRVTAGVIGGIGGGALGWWFGRLIPFVRGTVIYKRP